MISCVIATRNRPAELQLTLENVVCYKFIDEIIVVNDGGSSIEFLYENFSNLHIIELDTGRGPGKAKLLGIQTCRNDTVLIVDDDIDKLILPDLEVIDNLIGSYDLIQGKIYEDESGGLRSYEQPFIFYKNRQKSQRIAYFVGAIHLVNKKSFLAAGCYEDIMTYGFEELEASIKLIKNGYKLYFCPELNLVHLKTQTTRDSSHVTLEKLLYNRLIISSYYPFPFNVLSSIIWRCKTQNFKLKIVKLDKRPLLGWSDLFRRPRLLVRALF